MQVFSALKVLTSLALSCRLDEDLVVKVADFGLSKDLYEKLYYVSKDRTQKMPLKWMAPESLDDSIYTIKSDVVSNYFNPFLFQRVP